MRRRLTLTALVLAIAVPLYVWLQPAAVAGSLPERLTDAAFWELSETLSEPDGYFHADNLVSNEIWLQHVIPDLERRVGKGRVYLGVGPEQNYTYMAALEPAMAFIVDVRRGNLHLHLMYKALFDLSADRADFLSRLFSRPRPEGLTEASTVAELMIAYSRVPASEELYKRTLAEIREYLLGTRRLPLGADDLAGIDYVVHEFYSYGPGNSYRSRRGGPWGRRMPDYADVMLSTDAEGQQRAFLTSERHYRTVKHLHARNLVIPVVGNFGGEKAVRAVGEYVRSAGATVGAFYLSNVEQYLWQQGLADTFCGNVAALPLDDSSTFIRSVRGRGTAYLRPGYRAPGLVNQLGDMKAETARCR